MPLAKLPRFHVRKVEEEFGKVTIYDKSCLATIGL